VDLRRQLAADRSDAFNPDLAASLNNLSSCLSDLGHRERALEVIQEAVDLYRQLAADRPQAFNPDLAMSLNNLSNRLSNLGYQECALEVLYHFDQFDTHL
jgi:tetratricopeptide (TPR) repeat protein